MLQLTDRMGHKFIMCFCFLVQLNTFGSEFGMCVHPQSTNNKNINVYIIKHYFKRTNIERERDWKKYGRGNNTTWNIKMKYFILIETYLLWMASWQLLHYPIDSVFFLSDFCYSLINILNNAFLMVPLDIFRQVDLCVMTASYR